MGAEYPPHLASSPSPPPAVGTYSLFPLLFGQQEYPIKVSLPSWRSSGRPAAVAGCSCLHCSLGTKSKAPTWIAVLQVLLLVTFKLIASAWLPQLPLEEGGPKGSSSSKKVAGKGARSSSRSSRSCQVPLLPRHERLYLWGLVAVELATSWVLPPLLGERLPFLPLMGVSLYCSLGMLYCWAKMAAQACW